MSVDGQTMITINLFVGGYLVATLTILIHLPFALFPCFSALEYCTKRPKTGFCRHKLPRWYYDKNSDDCEPFSFTGCGGNNNNFHTYEDCLKVCKRKYANSSRLDLPETSF